MIRNTIHSPSVTTLLNYPGIEVYLTDQTINFFFEKLRKKVFFGIEVSFDITGNDTRVLVTRRTWSSKLNMVISTIILSFPWTLLRYTLV